MKVIEVTWHIRFEHLFGTVSIGQSIWPEYTVLFLAGTREGKYARRKTEIPISGTLLLLVVTSTASYHVRSSGYHNLSLLCSLWICTLLSTVYTNYSAVAASPATSASGLPYFKRRTRCTSPEPRRHTTTYTVILLTHVLLSNITFNGPIRSVRQFILHSVSPFSDCYNFSLSSFNGRVSCYFQSLDDQVQSQLAGRSSSTFGKHQTLSCRQVQLPGLR